MSSDDKDKLDKELEESDKELGESDLETVVDQRKKLWEATKKKREEEKSSKTTTKVATKPRISTSSAKGFNFDISTPPSSLQSPSTTSAPTEDLEETLINVDDQPSSSAPINLHSTHLTAPDRRSTLPGFNFSSILDSSIAEDSLPPIQPLAKMTEAELKQRIKDLEAEKKTLEEERDEEKDKADKLAEELDKVKSNVSAMFGDDPASKKKPDPKLDITLQELQDLVRKRQDVDMELAKRKHEDIIAKSMELRKIEENLTNIWAQSEAWKELDPASYEEQRKLVLTILESSQRLKEPTLYDELRLSSTVDEGARGAQSKIIGRIKKFTGTDPTQSWEQFLSQFNTMVANTNYRDSELKSYFLASLDGNASEHYRANEHEYIHLNYSQLVEKFNKRYSMDKSKGVLSIVGISQKQDEDILTFHDRFMNVAKTNLPHPPSRYEVAYILGKERLLETPMYSEKYAAYLEKRKQHEPYLIQHFLKGLREPILNRLPTTDFETLEEASTAARTAERTLHALNQLKGLPSFNIQAETVNAITGQDIQAMDRRNSFMRPTQKSNFRSNSKSRSIRHSSEGTKSSECFRCGQTGHWKSQCTMRVPSRNQSGNRSRSTSPGRFQNDSKIDQLISAVQQLTTNVQQITNGDKGDQRISRENFPMNRDRFSRSRSRSKSGNRSGSRSQSRERSFSRTRSRSRSQSRGRKVGKKNKSKN
jgi:Zinc knuckle